MDRPQKEAENSLEDILKIETEEFYQPNEISKISNEDELIIPYEPSSPRYIEKKEEEEEAIPVVQQSFEILEDPAATSSTVSETVSLGKHDIDIRHKETQTNPSNVAFRLELGTSSLRDLSDRKKNILLRLKKAFHIDDSRDLKSIEERIKHRISDRSMARP